MRAERMRGSRSGQEGSYELILLTGFKPLRESLSIFEMSCNRLKLIYTTGFNMTQQQT